MQAESSGKCSPNILSNKGTVQFVCNTTIDTATAAKIVVLLNRILQQKNDSGGEVDVNRKLDEILGFLRSEAQAHEQRQLPSDQLNAVKQALSAHPAKIWIWYSGQDGEAYQLAKQISEVLVSSGWSLKEPLTGAMTFVEGGGPPLYGIEVRYRGQPPPTPGARLPFDSSTSWGLLVGVLSHFFPDTVYLSPDPTMDTDLIHLHVYPNPKSKPAPPNSK
jgi:hypothetical protein